MLGDIVVFDLRGILYKISFREILSEILNEKHNKFPEKRIIVLKKYFKENYSYFHIS